MEILKRDIDIYYNVWEDTENPKLLVQIIHGMSEHISRYDDFAKFLNAHGILVYGMDLRGHGRTGLCNNTLGIFADVDGWDRVLEDQRSLYALFRKKYPNIPFVLLGHSMGSFFTRNYINEYPQDFQAAIIMGTGKSDDISYNFARFILLFLKKKAPSKLIHSLAFNGFIKDFQERKTILDWLSTDEKQVKKYIDDELCDIALTNGFYKDFMHGMAEITRLEKNIRAEIPCLFISGNDDPVGRKGEFVRGIFSKYKKATNAKMLLLEGMRHEILNERGKNISYNEILKWLRNETGFHI